MDMENLKFVFLVPLPVLVFEDLATVDFKSVWDTKFVLFCLGATIVSILIVTLISFLWKDKSIQGEFVQGSYRSSAALMGIAFIQNIYGNAGLAPLMIIGSVPLYNVMAVIVLSFLKPGNKGIDKETFIKTIKGIFTNPIIIGIVLGLVWSIFKLPMPVILEKTVSRISALATPMGLMAMGATFDLKKAVAKVKPTLVASFIKLIGLAAIFLPIAIYMGFRNDKLIAILVMLGSTTTISCYVMAKNMGHEGTLTSAIVMVTTLLSAFTLTMWLFILKSYGLI